MINECSNTETKYSVITIYQKYSYYESSWYSTRPRIGEPSDCPPTIAGYKKGHFEILDNKLHGTK